MTTVLERAAAHPDPRVQKAGEDLEAARKAITEYDEARFATAWTELARLGICPEDLEWMTATVREQLASADGSPLHHLTAELTVDLLHTFAGINSDGHPSQNQPRTRALRNFTDSLLERVRVATVPVAGPKQILIEAFGAEAFPARQPEQIQRNWGNFTRLLDDRGCPEEHRAPAMRFGHRLVDGFLSDADRVPGTVHIQTWLCEDPAGQAFAERYAEPSSLSPQAELTFAPRLLDPPRPQG